MVLAMLLALLTWGCSSKDEKEPDPGDASVGDVIFYEPPVTKPVEDMVVYPDQPGAETGAADSGAADGGAG